MDIFAIRGICRLKRRPVAIKIRILIDTTDTTEIFLQGRIFLLVLDRWVYPNRLDIQDAVMSCKAS